MKNNENHSHCSLCKGQCCKNLAGSYTPEDIGLITVKNIVSLLATGKYAIDWWDGDARDTPLKDSPPYHNLDRTLYLRPRHVGRPAIAKENDPDHAPSTCVNLTSKGCCHSFNKRPYQCRALIPNFNKKDMEPNCMLSEDGGSRQQIAIKWVPYQEILERVIALNRKYPI